MTLVLVSRDKLEELLKLAWASCDYGEGISYLAPNSPMVILAVEAGVKIPGPMAPGTVPPAPPQHPFDVAEVFRLMRMCEERMTDVLSGGEAAAGTYRAAGDTRLRCIDDGKVIYTSQAQAENAAERISEREPMKAYRGRCGHYHVSRRKK